MELAIAEYEASISKMVCATLQIASERAQDVIEAARKKRKLNQVTEQEEVLKKNEVKDSDDEESEEEEQGTKEYVKQRENHLLPISFLFLISHA
jgi:hypothetical protein